MFFSIVDMADLRKHWEYLKFKNISTLTIRINFNHENYKESSVYVEYAKQEGFVFKLSHTIMSEIDQAIETAAKQMSTYVRVHIEHDKGEPYISIRSKS